MSYIELKQTKFVATVVSVIVLALVASRQFYLSVVFRNAQGLLDAQGGKYHLWWAVGATLMTCLVGSLMYRFFYNDQVRAPRAA